jgi:hypothetical protein
MRVAKSSTASGSALNNYTQRLPTGTAKSIVKSYHAQSIPSALK